MRTIKQKKIASLLTKKLSHLFNSNKIHKEILIIDIINIDISYDLKLAKVYLSFFPDNKYELLSNIKMFYNKYYKKELSQIIRYQIKTIPKIIFYLDYSCYNINIIEKALNRKGEHIIK